MHELSITRKVVAICSEHAGGARVTQVTLEIGTLSSVMPDAVRFCFEACARGTPVEGAKLEIVQTPGRARCRDCGGELALTQPVGHCECGSTDLELIAGGELRVMRMEVV